MAIFRVHSNQGDRPFIQLEITIFGSKLPIMAYSGHFFKIFPTEFLKTHLGWSFEGWSMPLESGNADAFLFWGLYWATA